MMKVEINIAKNHFWMLIGLMLFILSFLVFAAKPIPVGHSKNEVEGFVELEQKVEKLSQEGVWPAGSYCLLQAGGNCPSGFNKGEVCIDSMDKEIGPYEPGNNDRRTGSYGDNGINACGDSSVQFQLCCK